MKSKTKLKMKLKIVLLVVSLFCIKKSNAQHTDVINSNRPGESMSAFAVGKTVIQVESGLNYLSEDHNLLNYKADGFGLDLNLRYGFLKEELEALIEVAYQNDIYKTDLGSTKRSGIKSTTIGLKYLVYDPYKNRKEKVNLYSWKASHKFSWNQLIPSVAVYGGANLNFSANTFMTGTEELSKVSPKAMLITQNQFGNGYVFVTNIFMDKIGTEFQSLEYIITLTKGFNDKWSGFLENKGIKSDYYADGIFRGGAAYLLTEDLQIDASVSKNYKNTPAIFYGGIGISWRYDGRYEDVVMRTKKDKKPKDKSKKGKEKAKAKERLDSVK